MSAPGDVIPAAIPAAVETADATTGPARNRLGTLYLAPTPLAPGDDPTRVLPPATIDALTDLDYVIAENARSARAVLGKLPLAHALQSIEIAELNQHTNSGDLPALLAPLLQGRDGALMSEAGCPAVADPGAALVALAHRRGLKVVPLIGPSSLLLALMASGMNGQRFAFAGYVPVPDADRTARLRELERRSAREAETQILIETPYRNQALFDAMLRALGDDTLLGIATELSQPAESIALRTIDAWRRAAYEVPRAPTVFTILAAGRIPSAPPPSSVKTGRRRRR